MSSRRETWPSQNSVRPGWDDFAQRGAVYPDGVDQSKRPDDFYRDQADKTFGWHEGTAAFEITSNQIPAGATGVDLHVRLFGGASSTVHVDAARIERLVEKQFAYDLNGNLTIVATRSLTPVHTSRPAKSKSVSVNRCLALGSMLAASK